MSIGTLHTERDLERFIENMLDRELANMREVLGWDYSGNGSPEGVVTAPIGARYRRKDAAPALYVKETGTGNTGWVAK